MPSSENELQRLGRDKIWRIASGMLGGLGVAVPCAAALISPVLSARTAMLSSSAGLFCVLAAIVLFARSERDRLLQRIGSWDPMIRQMRNAGLRLDQMQRRLSEIDENRKDIGMVQHLLNEERHNLSLVALGMAEIRDIIGTERTNLGALAAGVHQLRLDSDRRETEAERVFVEVRDFAEIVTALRTHLDALSAKLVALEERSIVEQSNLGSVAAGLDGIRRSANGIERFDKRQTAFEDALLIISERIDGLLTIPPTTHSEAA